VFPTFQKGRYTSAIGQSTSSSTWQSNTCMLAFWRNGWAIAKLPKHRYTLRHKISQLPVMLIDQVRFLPTWQRHFASISFANNTILCINVSHVNVQPTLWWLNQPERFRVCLSNLQGHPLPRPSDCFGSENHKRGPVLSLLSFSCVRGPTPSWFTEPIRRWHQWEFELVSGPTKRYKALLKIPLTKY